MKKRRRFTRTEIVKLLTRWKRSGLTKRQFCRNEKIAHSTFANWFKKYSREVDLPRLCKALHKIGRKNYLFAGSSRGAQRAAIFYSLHGT
ncbi:MAG: IS66 family insertion sequence element accessory protein TnpA [Candidatus Hodarchaeales archaeon]